MRPSELPESSENKPQSSNGVVARIGGAILQGWRGMKNSIFPPLPDFVQKDPRRLVADLRRLMNEGAGGVLLPAKLTKLRHILEGYPAYHILAEEEQHRVFMWAVNELDLIGIN